MREKNSYWQCSFIWKTMNKKLINCLSNPPTELTISILIFKLLIIIYFLLLPINLQPKYTPPPPNLPIQSNLLSYILLWPFVYLFLISFHLAKTIELDERIPFISKLQSYSGLISFKPKDFATAEIVILKELSWNL